MSILFRKSEGSAYPRQILQQRDIKDKVSSNYLIEKVLPPKMQLSPGDTLLEMSDKWGHNSLGNKEMASSISEVPSSLETDICPEVLPLSSSKGSSPCNGE
ncbi:hypothetical protein PR048_010840 [Dryococelus australis]|uniref:Uncharacterized protein n=1 Tax=Dryococelus australis TaxID=614101 RepID=A0ABQ9I510_9NEOP|nr:hypothetical protein PR048_010840 [Dryococelus australis]